MKKDSFLLAVKVILLSTITFGIYGAYWIMKNLYSESDYGEEEGVKDSEFTQRAVASAFLVRHDLH